MKDFAVTDINNDLITEITEALKNTNGWGSVEIMVQNNKVVQITQRSIKKVLDMGQRSLIQGNGTGSNKIGIYIFK